MHSINLFAVFLPVGEGLVVAAIVLEFIECVCVKRNNKKQDKEGVFMRSVQDALYNWLTIKTVAEARPDDSAAKETYLLFQNMIYEEHKLRNVEVEKNEEMYLITYEMNGERKSARFPLEAIDCFWIR